MMIRITVDQRLGDAELADLENGFAELGFPSVTSVVPPRRGPDVGLLLVVSLPLSAFLSTLGSSLAQDAHDGLRSLVRRALRRDPERTLLLEDAVSGTCVVLEEDLPAEGYRALFSTDLHAHAGATWRYDRSGQHWARAEHEEPGEPGRGTRSLPSQKRPLTRNH